jgi:hypothetical protein
MTKCHCGKHACYNYPLHKAKFCSNHKDDKMIDVKNKRCEIDNCRKQPNYNFSNETKGRFCNEHKHTSMIDIKNKTCEMTGCKKQPTYNFSNETRRRFCNEHKLPNMVDIKNKTCKIIGCRKQPTYNYPGEKMRSFCNVHKDPSMINVKDKLCEIYGCTKIPCFNIYGKSSARFCAEHKEPDMTNIRSNICEISGCKTEAIFNTFGEKNSRFCNKHKLPNMINIKDKKCEFDRCLVIPVYNFSGKTNGRFCATHKEKNMINVKNIICNSSKSIIKYKQKCEFDGCQIYPTYNFFGQKHGKFCTTHKELNMVNVVSKICKIAGCKKQPVYNFSSEKRGCFCTIHKESNMVDVKHNICENTECTTRTLYGWLGKKSSYCGPHKQKGMISYPTKECKSCKQLGTYELASIRYCEDHKPDGSQNLGLQKCTSCGLDDILTNGKCSTCDPVIIELQQHAKENHIRDIFNANGLDQFIHDKMLEGPICGRERPDFQFDCGTHFVYVEVDENQHKSYPCECEQIRMINLVEARGIPVRFIRYNPDSYQPITGQSIITNNQREKKLIEYVKYAMNHSPIEDTMFANVLYLFYDEYNTQHQEWNKLI